MTTIVRIHHPKTHINQHVGPTHELVLSDTAKEHVRHKFNPSGLPEVNNLKALAAAFISFVEQLRENDKTGAGHEFDEAIKLAKTASMWAVSGATKGK